MGDYFFNLLPVGHGIRLLPIAAATISLTAKPALVAPVSLITDESRRQCATVAWMLGGAYSTASVIALPLMARTYLARMFGVNNNAPRTAAAQSARIDAHRAVHHPELTRKQTSGAAAAAAAAAEEEEEEEAGAAALPPPSPARTTLPVAASRPTFSPRPTSQRSSPLPPGNSGSSWTPPEFHTTRRTPALTS